MLYVGRHVFSDACVQRVEEWVLVYGNALCGHIPEVYVFLSGGCLCNIYLRVLRVYSVYVCEVCTHTHTHCKP